MLGESIHLLGYDVRPVSKGLDTTIYWQAEGRVSEDYTTFIHLLGPKNPETGSTIWAESDAQPGNGTYPTSQWRPGQIIVDRYYLQIPDQSPRQNYQLEVGMYILATGARLPVRVNGQPSPDNSVLLGDVTH